MTKKRRLKTQLYTVNHTEAGYAIAAPQHRGLVLSGGGAKGIAYAGMIKAMYERGFIQQLSHVSGASAGAMTASLIALGMSPDDIEKLVTQLDIKKLLNENYGLRAIGERFRNMLEIIYIQQIKQVISNVDWPLAARQNANFDLILNKISVYDGILAKKGIVLNSMDDVIALGQNLASLGRLDAAFARLPTRIHNALGELLETPRVTFADLARLRALLPDAQKQLIKHLSVVTTNQSKNELETYNEDLAAHESIAEKVQESGAHPALFVPRRNAQRHYIADGGILDNMPSHVLESAGLNKEEILCVKAVSDSRFRAHILKAKVNAPEALSGFSRFIDNIASHVVGGRVFKSLARVSNREKIFHHIGNMLYLNTGHITTTSVSPSVAEKKRAIDTAYQQTHDLLDENNKVFNNPLMAMLYLGVDKLDERLISESLDDAILHSAFYAKKIFLLQESLVREMNQQIYHVDDYVKEISDILTIDAGLDKGQSAQALALCLKQVDHYSEGRLEDYLVRQLAYEKNEKKISYLSWLLNLLWASIEWVLSCFTKNTHQAVIEPIESRSPALANFGLFVTAHNALLEEPGLHDLASVAI